MNEHNKYHFVVHSPRGFTLVELVVVITILAILGTVSLLAFRGYSGDARNSKRITDLHNIKARIIEQISNGQNLLNFVTSNVENRVPALATPLISGVTPSNGANYDAGSVNYPTIGIIQEDFSDPSSAIPYSYGATTIFKGGAYQIAAKMDPVDDGLNHAYILGNYKPRATSGLAGYVNAGNVLGAGPLGGKVFSISNPGVGIFRVGDTVTCNPACTAPVTRTITKLSADGLNITFGVAITTATTALTAISINGNDNIGLIDENNSNTSWPDAAGTIVVHDGSVYMPY